MAFAEACPEPLFSLPPTDRASTQHRGNRAWILPSLPSADLLLRDQCGDCINTGRGRNTAQASGTSTMAQGEEKKSICSLQGELVWAGGRQEEAGWAGAFQHGAALAAPPHMLQCCWLCHGTLLLQIPIMLFSNLIFSGTDLVLALGNWHSPYWQMFLICFK